MKGLIIAGGEGTRLLPFTKVINKHLLPVGGQPMIYWALMKLKEAGIKQIAIVTMQNDIHDFKKVLGDGKQYDLSLTYFRQAYADGIASAVRCAGPFIANKKSVVLLGDNLFDASLAPYIEEFKQIEKGAMVLIKEVENPTRFAVAKVNKSEKKVLSIVEKPTEPLSNLCVTGIYFFDEQLLDEISSIRRSARYEYEITDINNAYVERGELHYRHLDGWWIDAGTHQSLFEANKRMFTEN